MFVETRSRGKQTLYYLIHSYRIGGSVKRISRYLGANLSAKNLAVLRKSAGKLILLSLSGRSSLELTSEELDNYRQYEDALHISHLNKKFDWDSFTKEFTYSTNAIEGSTVAFDKAKKLINRQEAPKNLDELETLNVAHAVSFIRKSKAPPTLSFIKKLHLLCFIKTKPFAGKLRSVEVVVKDISGNIVHSGAKASQVASLLNNLASWYSKNKNSRSPLFLASVMHNQFEHIHPFQDGNGRVGRLILNYILLRHGYPPVNIKLSDRKRYYSALRAFDRRGNVKPMMRLLVSCYRRK